MTIAAREYDFEAARQRLEAKPKSAGPKLALARGGGRAREGRRSRGPRRLPLLAHARWPWCGRCCAGGRGASRSRATSCATRASGAWWRARWTRSSPSWMGIGLPWGLSRIQREFVEAGRVEFEEWSHLGLGLRYRAAAMGVPFLPSLTMLGSGLMGVGGSKTVDVPLHRPDPPRGARPLSRRGAASTCRRRTGFGNCQIDGYPHMDADIARAATTVLVTAEEIVSEDEIRLQPRPDRHPRLHGGRARARALRLLPARVLRRLRRRARALHRATWTGSSSAARPAVADYLERYVYAPGDPRGLPGPLRRRAPWPTRPPRAAGCSPRERHRQRAARRDGRARAARQHHRLHRRRRAHDGLGAGPAHARPAAHHDGRGRRHRAHVEAGRAADLHQRDARGLPGPDAARHHRRLPARPARLLRRGLHRRRPDRPARQPQHQRHRRLRAAQGAAARQRRRQRHHLALPRGAHPHRPREAALHRARGLRHEPRLPGRRRLPPAPRPALRRRLARGHHARHLRLRAGEPPHAAPGPAPGRHRGAGAREHRLRGPGEPAAHHHRSRPTDDELAILRMLDPKRQFIG